MGNFSINPDWLLNNNLSSGYVGLRIEQGVPLLDRDLNLLGDLVAAQLRKVIDTYIGSGAPLGSSGFAIGQAPFPPPDNDFIIGAGDYLTGGFQVSNPGTLNYSAQAGAPPLTAGPATGTRDDVVYLDVWYQEVTSATDASLSNPNDLGMQTSVRLKLQWMVRVAQNTVAMPAAAVGHAHALLAKLKRTGAKILGNQITDARTLSLNLADCVRRVDLLEALLKPAFTSSAQLSTLNSYAGQTVTLNGKNFNLGTVRVELMGPNGLVTPPLAATPGNPSPTQIAITVPANAAGSHLVTVFTDLGSTTANDRLNLYGTPAFKAAPGQFSPSTAASLTPFEVTLFGSYFDAPNTRVFIKHSAMSGGVTELTIKPDSITSSQLVAFVPQLVAGTLRFSVTTVVGSSANSTSTELLTLYGPPAFKAAPGQFSPSTAAANTSFEVTLFGSYFDASNTKVFMQKTGVAGSSELTIKPGSITSSQLVALVPPQTTGTFRFTVTTAMGSSALTTEQLTIS